MLKLNKILIINLLIVLAMNVLIMFPEPDLGKLILGTIFLAVQVLVNLSISLLNFIQGNHANAKSFLLSAFFVALIGFSVCNIR